MKVAAILVTAVLAVGTGAIAQTRDAGDGDSLGKKAGRLFDRAENAIKRGVDNVSGGSREARQDGKQEAKETRQGRVDERRADDRRDDTRAMGAGKSENRSRADDRQTPTNDRQARMDDAYGNWKSQPQR